MKESFIEYYAPTEAEYKELIENSVVILDTNVLTELYKVSNQTREELLSSLESIKDRVWIPFHVGIEFNRNRLEVIKEKNKELVENIATIKKSVAIIKKSIIDLELEKRNIEFDSAKLDEHLNSVVSDVDMISTKLEDNLSKISLHDPIRDRLDLIFSGRVGERIKSDEDLESMLKGAEYRFDNKIPPGFEDIKKGGAFYFDGVKYENKYGDLVIWKQILNYVAKFEFLQNVIFVTNDRKLDWWLIYDGKTLGPRSELIREILATGKVKKFWMYDSESFQKSLGEFTKVELTSAAIEDLQRVNSLDDERAVLLPDTSEECIKDLDYISNISRWSRIRRFAKNNSKNYEFLGWDKRQFELAAVGDGWVVDFDNIDSAFLIKKVKEDPFLFKGRDGFYVGLVRIFPGGFSKDSHWELDGAFSRFSSFDITGRILFFIIVESDWYHVNHARHLDDVLGDVCGKTNTQITLCSINKNGILEHRFSCGNLHTNTYEFFR